METPPATGLLLALGMPLLVKTQPPLLPAPPVDAALLLEPLCGAEREGSLLCCNTPSFINMLSGPSCLGRCCRQGGNGIRDTPDCRALLSNVGLPPALLKTVERGLPPDSPLTEGRADAKGDPRSPPAAAAARALRPPAAGMTAASSSSLNGELMQNWLKLPNDAD